MAIPAKGAARYDTWTTQQGLPQNSVWQIRQTPDGYLWLTTLDGLVRFDGVRFTVFNRTSSPDLPTNRLSRLFAAPDGDLWVGAEGVGLVRFRGGRCRTFTPRDGLPSPSVSQVQPDGRGGLLIETILGTVFLRDGAIVPDPRSPGERPVAIHVGPSGTRWELGRDCLSEIRGGRERRYPLPFDPELVVPDPFFSPQTVRLLEAPEGVLWIALFGGVFRFQDGVFTGYTEGAPRARINALIRDRHGTIWLATQGEGACRLDGGRFTCERRKDGLAGDDVSDIFEDREGTLWFGSNGYGFSRRTPRAVTTLSVEDGLVDHNVYSVLAGSDGSVWIGTNNGLSRWASGRFSSFGPREGLTYPTMQALCEDRAGDLWVGAVGGLFRMSKGRFVEMTSRTGFDRSTIWAIRQDAAGTIWLGTEKGLLHYEAGVFRRYTTMDGLPSDDVKDVLVARDGSVWLATYGGLARFDGTRFTSWTERDGLPSSFLRALHEDDDGTLWIGTYDRGLTRFRGGRFTSFSTASGLFSDGVFAIVPDGFGNFWMTSNQGISRVVRSTLEQFADGQIGRVETTAFGALDGMLNVECNGGRQPSAARTADGRIWFPTQDGVAVIDPAAVPRNPLPPPVVFESVTIQERPVPFDAVVRVAPNDRNLALHYTALSFIKSDQIRFRYRLKGLDEKWTEAGTRRSAFYPYLLPGHYVFQVVAANSDGVWNDRGASVSIVVLPAFHQTWWFQIALAATVVAAVVAAVAGYNRRRSARYARERAAQEEFARGLIRAHESERRRVAAELHDSLGQSLALIKNQAVYGGTRTGGDEDAGPGSARAQFDEIAAQASHAIAEVREIAYNLRPYLLERLGLTQALRSMLRRVDATGSLHLTEDVDDIDHLLPEDAELSLYRMLQESLNNVLKHARATEAVVTIKRTPGSIRVTVRDDGKGFTPGESGARDGEGFGLTGIAERVRLLGGTYRIESAPGEGTTITMEIPRPRLEEGAAS